MFGNIYELQDSEQTAFIINAEVGSTMRTDSQNCAKEFGSGATVGVASKSG